MLFEVRFLAPGIKGKKDVKEMEKGRNELGKMRPMPNLGKKQHQRDSLAISPETLHFGIPSTRKRKLKHITQTEI